MGGTGSKQEDQIITVAIEKAAGVKFTYVPFKGGGDVAVQLVGKHIDSSVNNPIEAVAQWRAGQLRPLCVFDDTRMPYKTKVTDTMSWNDIPSCKEAGLATDYLMLRGIFMPGGVTQEQVDYYVDLFKKVRETPEWKKFMEDGAFNQTFMTGRRVREVGRAGRKHPPRPDEGSRVPRQALATSDPRPRGNPARSCHRRRRDSPHAFRRIHARTSTMTETPLPDPDERVGVSLRMMDIIVALLLLVVGAVVVYDSYRLGCELGQRRPGIGILSVPRRPADLHRQRGDAGAGGARAQPHAT